MDEEEKRALSTSLPDLIKAVKVDTRFKTTVIASRVFDSHFLDRLFESESKSGAELVFHLVQYLKKSGTRSGLEQFTGVLTSLGQDNAVAILQRELAAHRGGCQESDDAVRRVDSDAEATASSTIRFSKGPDETTDDDMEELRQGIARTLPEEGFIAVTSEYCSLLYKFVELRGPFPGPLQLPDVSKTLHEKDDLSYISVECSALISSRYNFEHPNMLRFCETEPWKTLQTNEDDIKYYGTRIVIKPGGTMNSGVWLSADATLEEAFAETTSFQHFRVASHDQPSFADLSLRIGEWAPSQSSRIVDIYRGLGVRESIGVTDKQKLLNRLRSAERKVKTLAAVIPRYAKSVKEFAKEETDKEPGELQCIEGRVAYNEANVGFLPAECCAALIEFYGTSSPQTELLTKRKTSGITALFHKEEMKYITCVVYLQPTNAKIGSYLLMKDKYLRDAIAQAFGVYPKKVRAQGADTDIDLDLTVSEWFSQAEHIRLAVWL